VQHAGTEGTEDTGTADATRRNGAPGGSVPPGADGRTGAASPARGGHCTG